MLSALILSVSALIMSLPSTTHAKPDLTSPVDLSILHNPHSSYRFISQRFNAPAPILDNDSSTDLNALAIPRHYQVWLGIPAKQPSTNNNAANNTNSPSALYILDGNAAIDDLTLAQLQSLSASAQPPILVYVGYQTPTRFDVTARAYDYTPPLTTGDSAFVEAMRAERLNGGAEQFYQLLTHQIMPWVNTQAHLTQPHNSLWGHSYGALFTLYTLFEHPDSFERYYAIDPSLWWQQGDILTRHQMRTTTPSQPPASSATPYLYFAQSGHNADAPPAATAQRQQSDKDKTELAAQICQPTQTPYLYQCQYKQYQDKTHGELFPQGLNDLYADFISISSVNH